MTEAQFQGCLLGEALGDALGSPVEGQPPAECAAYVRDLLRHGLTIGRGPLPFGQYTDDTQLARELLVSLVECRGLDPADFGRRVGAIFADGLIVGRGRSTEEAAFRLAAGVPWNEAGTPGPKAGNGSAMRAAPIGLWFAGDPAALVAAARDQGIVTHKDPRCTAGAIAIAAATAASLRGGSIDRVAFADEIAALVEPVEAPFAAAIRDVGRWAHDATPDDAVARIKSSDYAVIANDRWQGVSPFVVPSVLYSLYAFLRTPDDYWETVLTAISPGGDVDTTAAMAGAIAGARHGIAALPPRLLASLTDQGRWGPDELAALAGRAFAIVSGART